MFLTIFIPVEVRKMAVILLLAIATLMPMSPVLAEEEIPTAVPSVVEPMPDAAVELETVDGVSEAEVLPDEVLVEPEVESEVRLTPEQALVLALQAKLTELTGSYSDERVESIQMNLSQHLLQVKVKEDWYNLESQQQDEMAQQLYSQAQKLAFTKLEMMNSQGQLIARNPVIGQRMIILDRYPD